MWKCYVQDLAEARPEGKSLMGRSPVSQVFQPLLSAQANVCVEQEMLEGGLQTGPFCL